MFVALLFLSTSLVFAGDKDGDKDKDDQGVQGKLGPQGVQGKIGPIGPLGPTGSQGPSISLGAIQLIGPFGSGGITAFSLQCPAGTVASGIRGRTGPGTTAKGFGLRCTEISGGISALTGAVFVSLGATSNTAIVGTGSTTTTADCPSGMVMTGFRARFLSGIFRQFTGRCTDIFPGTSTGNTPTISAFSLGTVTTIDCPAGTLITGVEGLLSGSTVKKMFMRCQ